MRKTTKLSLLILILITLSFTMPAQDVIITGDSTINQCETKTYMVSIQNTTDNPLTNLIVTARLANLTGFSYVNGSTSIDVNGGGTFCTADPAISGTDLIWNIDTQCGGPFTLNNLDTLNITLNLQTDCTAVSGSLNIRLDYQIGGTPMVDETGAHSIQVLPGGLTIKKTPNVIPQELWQDVTWTLTIENTGFGTVKNVVVTDVLGAGLVYVSSTPGGINSGQTTTWSPSEIPGFSSMNPGDIISIDITATVVACENLGNTADARWGCDMVTDCYNTANTVPPSTATASVQRIVKTPLIQFTPPDVAFNYCDDYVDVNFTISNIGDGRAHDVWIGVDFGPLTVSDISAGAIYNSVDKRFELTAPLLGAPGPGNSYDLSFRLNFNTWCGGSFPTGQLLWQTVYNDDCGNPFYPPVELSAINAPLNSPGLTVGKTGAPATVQIGAQITYTITSAYSGPLNCGSGSTGLVTVVDTLPDGFTVIDAGGGTWVPGAGGTGGTVTWNYTPPASLNTSITVQSPNRTDCETYCFTTFTNNITATVVDCCGCTLNANSSQTTAIECEELVDSDKTAIPVIGIRCSDIQYTNTYIFADNAALDTVDISELIFRENAENEQAYVAGSLQVTLSGSGDITACAQSGMTDTTPGAGGNLSIDFSNCNTYGSVRNKTLTITYRLRITEDTVGACGGLTFYSWSSLDFDLASGSECLPDGTIYETTQVSVEAPGMTLSISGLSQIIDKCRTETITLTLTQTSGTANPRDVRLMLSGLNYYVVNPAATLCSGDVAPTSCTPTLVGNDYVWYFADGFNGTGQRAVLQLTVVKRCTAGGELSAVGYFDDNCNDDADYDDTCSVNAAATPALLLSGDLLIEKNPEVYFASTDTVEWKIYVTNRGNGSAYNVWIDDILGTGLDFTSAAVSPDSGDVTVTADQNHAGGVINGCTIAITQMTAGQRRVITLRATLLNCNNLTNDVSASWGCVGQDCQVAVSDSSTVEIPRPLLINSNVVTTPADACTSPSGLITLKNAGQTTCYNLQVTETLPTGLLYVPGSTRWRVNGGGWNGPNAAYDPNPTVSPIRWTSVEIPALATADPGDTIEIEYTLLAGCAFAGGDITVTTSYENPCAQVFNTADSVFTVAFRSPNITVTKIRANEPIDCGELIEWTITVRNTSGYTLPIIWVEDTMDAAFTYSSSVGDPPYTSDNGTFDGVNTVAWELRNVANNDTVSLTLRATTDTSPCSPNLDNTVLAWWGCGAADGSSATKPGVNPPDNNLCLTTSATSTVRTETREPSVSFLDIALNPTFIDSCDDSTELTVTIQNTGPTDASNVDLVITLPPGITYVANTSAVTCGGVYTDPAPEPVVSGNQLIYYNVASTAANLCNLVQAAGGTDTVTLVFSVRSNCYVTDNVGFRLYYYDCCGDNQYNSSTNETLTALFPNLVITKTPMNSQIDCGDNQTWTITVNNNGTGNAQVVRIEDTLGNWIDYIGSVPAATAMPSAPSQVYGWEINNLAAGSSQSFDITGQLNPDAPQNSCSVLLRQDNARAIWGCGIAGDAVDNDPNTTGYDCTHAAWSNATAANLEMPDLVITAITPAITCTADGSFGGTISVTVNNQGDGVAVGGFQVSMADGTGWTGTGSYGSDLAPGGTAVINIDVTGWNPDCSPCTYNFSATVDSGDTVCECREDNNNFGPQSYSPAIPNVQVDNDTLAITCLADGQYRISGTVTLRNAGCTGVLTQNVPMRFTLYSGAGCSGAQVTQWTQTFTGVSIAAGATQVFTITNNDIAGNACTGASGCQFSISSEADYNNTICECDGTDNIRCSDKNFTIPDLRVVSDTLAISCSVDGQIRIQGDLVVANDGCGGNLATNIPIRISIYNNNAACSGANGNFVFNQAGVNIPAGGTQTFAINRTLNRNLCVNSTTCQVAVGVELDYSNSICECNGTNNNYCSPNKTFSIPDLQVTGDTLSINCLQDGQVRVSGTATIANTGCNAGVVGNLPVRVTLFSNINCGGVQLDQWTETFAGANIAAGGSQAFTITNRDIITNICTNSTGCQMSVRIEADPGAVICECNGGNNSRCSNKVISIPDLRITAVTPAITCTADGNLTGSVQVTVNNNGCSAANNIPVRLTSNCGYTFVDQNVAALAAGASTTLTFSFTPVISACNCTFTAAADPDNVICECNGTNNTLAAAPYNSIVPDLTVTDIDFSNVSCVNDNISGSVRVVVNNQGCGTANNFQVSLATDGCLNFSNQSVVSLAAGASTNVTFNISGSWADCTDGSCQFTAVVDTTGAVCEYNGANNSFTETYNSTLPDLVVNDIDFSGITCINDNISGSVSVTVNNRGFGNAANFQVALNTDGCLNFSNQPVANLAAGATTTVTFNVSGSWSGCTDCDCLFTAVVDAANTVCECDGTNNTHAETYTSTLPDLHVNSVTPGTTCIDDSNFQGTVTVNVANTGCAAANNAVVRLTSSCGYVFADQTVNLAMGANADVTFTYTPTCPNCNCTFTAVIDPDNTICECNGANNSLISGVFNMDVPDITVEADTLGITCSADGQATVSGTVTLGNRGCGANLTTNVPVRITLYDNTGCSGNTLDQWTQTFDVVNIPAGGGSQSFTVTARNIVSNLVTNSTNCRVSLRIEADYNDSICECDGTNNNYCTADKNVNIPDLQVTGDTLSVSCFSDGRISVSGTVTIANNGCGANLTADIPVRFNLYDNTGCSGGQINQWTQTFSAVNIPAGGTQTFTITPRIITSDIVNRATNCNVSLRITADYLNAICEADGNNNIRCSDKALDIPDIEVPGDDLNITCSTEGQVTISGTVILENSGCGSNLTADVPVRFTLFDNIGCSGNQLAQWTETLTGVNIPANSGTQALSITPYNYAGNMCLLSSACEVSLLIEADYNDLICESAAGDATNNNQCTNKTINIPDLSVNSVTPASTCTNDSSFQGTVSVNVTNAGCGDANNAVVRLTSSCGYVFADQTVNLPSGSNANVTFTYTPTCLNCNCTFTAVIDPDDAVCECDGTNNTLTSAPFSLDIPDVTVETDTLAVACAADGQVTVSGTVTLGNHGCGSNLTADVPVRLTLYSGSGCTGSQLNQWTQTLTGVNIVSGGGTQSFTITPHNINANLVANCLVSLRVEADYNDAVCECDGTNNNYCSADKNVDIPDIQVGADTLGVTCAADGQVTVSGNITMANNGCGSNLTANIPVRFTLYDSTGCSGNTLAQWTETLTGVDIAAGGTQVFAITGYNITTNLVTNSNNCNVSLRVEADFTNSICESDNSNNNYCADNKTVDIPDIRVQSENTIITCISSGQFRISGSVTLQNNGCGSNLATDVPIQFTLYNNPGCSGSPVTQWTETLTGVNIAADGGTQTFTLAPHDVTANACANSANCTVSLLIAADYSGTICESDGANNTLCSNKTLNMPNLVVNNVATSITCLNDGNLTGTMVNVANNGCADASGVVVRLTSDCGLTFADQVINLAAGESRDLEFLFLNDITTCNCTFTAVINPDNTVCECDSADNTRTSTNVMIIPDILIAAEALAVNCLNDGVIRVAGTVTLANDGCGADFTGSIPMRFTLFGNTGCGGNRLAQWTETFSAGAIPSGGGTRTFTVRAHDINIDFSTVSTRCMVSLLIEADYSDTICEWNGTNNTLCVDKTSECLDLETGQLTASTTCQSDGGITGRFTFIVRNSGGRPVTRDFQIRVNDGQGWSTEKWYQADLGGQLPLAPGASDTVTINWTRDFTRVPYVCNCPNITAVIDSQDNICESTAVNNTVSTSYNIPYPDLAVNNFAAVCSGDGRRHLRLTVGNDGCGPVTQDFNITFSDTPGQIQTASFTSLGGNLPLAVGDSQTVVLDRWTFDCTSENNECTVALDSGNQICDLNDANDTFRWFRPATEPDLVMGEVSWTCMANGSITFTATVSNQGNGPAYDAQFIVYDDGGKVVYTERINLAKDEVKSITFTSGTYPYARDNIFRFILDEERTVCECDGTNNERTVVVNCVLPPSECCLKIEETPLGPIGRPVGLVSSYIEPYFATEAAMFTVYAALNLWKEEPLAKETMPQFMKERLQNYARSTVEEFYFGSKLGLTLPDGSLWLSYAGAYPDQDDKAREKNDYRWLRRQVDDTMTASQVGFELLALNETVKVENREDVSGKLKTIIQKKLDFLSAFIDDLPHGWKLNDKKKNEEAPESDVQMPFENYVEKLDKKAGLYDNAALYLAMVELNKSGFSVAGTYGEKLKTLLEPIDNNNFDPVYLRAEFIFTLALLQSNQPGQAEQAKAKIQEFEKILATDKLSQHGQTRTEKKEKENRVVLDNIRDHALAAAVDYKAGGTVYDKLNDRIKEKYYMKDTGILADVQPDFTFKLTLESMAPLLLSFDTKDAGEQETNAAILYRAFDEVGLFLKKRNIVMGNPLYGLLKNYPFSEPLLPVLPLTKAKNNIAPVFSQSAVIHSTQLKQATQLNQLGEILIPQRYSKILSSGYETNASRIAAISFGLQHFGRTLMQDRERVNAEEGRSFDYTGKRYVESLLHSGAGIQSKGMTLLPFDTMAVKGPKQGDFNLEPLNAGTQFSTQTLADYLLAEKFYTEGLGKYTDNVRDLMKFQARIVAKFKETGYIPATFNIYIDRETEEITLVPSQERAAKLTIAKLFYVLPGDSGDPGDDMHTFLKGALNETQGTLMAEDIIFFSAAPGLVPYFKDEITKLVANKDAKVVDSAADVIGRQLLGEEPAQIKKSLDNLVRHWDNDAVMPVSDRVEHIERGLIYRHEPRAFLLYLLASGAPGAEKDFRFKRTLNFFTYLLENEWGVGDNDNDRYLTLPSQEYEIVREQPRVNAEAGDILLFKVKVENICAPGTGLGFDLPSLFIKAGFTPPLIYGGSEKVPGLEPNGLFQWRYENLLQGGSFEFIYQAYVPSDISANYIDGSITAYGNQGIDGSDPGTGDNCEDTMRLNRLDIVPLTQLRGVVFEDRNVNGFKDVGEPGIPNILFKDTRGYYFRSDAEGRFTFFAGKDFEGVQMELKSIPSNYLFIPPDLISYHGPHDYLVISDPTRLVNKNYVGEIYFGLIPCKTVTGFVYIDENDNNQYDEGETRPESVQLNAGDKQVVTSRDGQFIFRNLPELWQERIKISERQLFYKEDIKKIRIQVNK